MSSNVCVLSRFAILINHRYLTQRPVVLINISNILVLSIRITKQISNKFNFCSIGKFQLRLEILFSNILNMIYNMKFCIIKVLVSKFKFIENLLEKTQIYKHLVYILKYSYWFILNIKLYIMLLLKLNISVLSIFWYIILCFTIFKL